MLVLRRAGAKWLAREDERSFMKNNLDIRKCFIAVIGILLVGVGVSFNAMAGLGNDPVGIFYDGMRSAMGLNQEQLGMASNIVNIVLAVFLFFAGRRYLNMGTLIYIIPYGICVDIGTYFYGKVFVADALWCQIVASVIGCLLLYAGVAIFIAVDIGLDPMTGTAMVVRDGLKWDFKKAKWLFDGVMTLLGWLLGGRLGVVTILTAISAGPVIQFIAGKVAKMINRLR